MTLDNTTPSTDESTSVMEALEFEIPCDTKGCDEHPADVYLTLSCGHGWFTCSPHAVEAREILEKAHAITVLTGISCIACAECQTPDVLAVSITPIKADSSKP